MKFLAPLFAISVALISSSLFAQGSAVPTPNIAAKSFVLLDYQSGQVIASQKPDERIEPASLTKLMTAYIAFSAIKQKKLSLTQAIPVSTRAWKAEGSRMFIDLKQPVTVDELLHGMIIQSGNDASIALAEAIAGSEELFAQLMNKEAQRLGLTNSHFMNATGLPAKEHYSTTADMAKLAADIIRDYPEFFPLYSQKSYTYNKITQPNRNRLLWTDKFVDGMKTGHTDAAGFCLVSTAKRAERRLISVVAGATSDNARTVESQKLLNYGFQFFDTQRLYAQGQSVATLDVFKGEANTVNAGFQRDLYLTLPREQFAKLKATLATTQPLLAPLTAGQRVGTMKLMLDNAAVGEYPVVALQAVPAAGFFGRAWDSVKLLWKK
ncbi:MAG: D-alanyl-D-alanine carboxypeptidase [Burkholderiales bacterium]|nr:D-alanyl-D-alanine carboxypeptidase [Burkholderiales bacterium]